MATPVQPVPGLCSDPVQLQTFINQVNTAFESVLQTIQEQFGITIDLPGVPPVTFVTLGSGFGAQDPAEVARRSSWAPVDNAFVGHRFRTDQGGRVRQRVDHLGGLPAFQVPGRQFPVGGADPVSYTMTLINKNYEIIVNRLREEGVNPQILFLPPNPCAENPELRIPEIINNNNDTLEDQQPSLPCLGGSVPGNFSDSAWIVTDTGAGFCSRFTNSMFATTGASVSPRNHFCALTIPSDPADRLGIGTPNGGCGTLDVIITWSLQTDDPNNQATGSGLLELYAFAADGVGGGVLLDSRSINLSGFSSTPSEAYTVTVPLGRLLIWRAELSVSKPATSTASPSNASMGVIIDQADLG